MAQGLDELVEWLVGEVSFYGDGESNEPSPSPWCRMHNSHIAYLQSCSISRELITSSDVTVVLLVLSFKHGALIRS